MTAANPTIRAFFDEPANTVGYLVFDRATKIGAVVDPVLDFDHRNGKVSTRRAASPDAGDPGQHPRRQVPPAKSDGVSCVKIPVQPRP